MFDNLSQREKVLLIVAFLLIILVSYYFYIYQPMKENIARFQQKKSQKNNKLKTARNLARKLPDLKEKYNKLHKQRNKNSGELVQATSTINLLRDIEELTRENGVKLVGFSPAEKENKVNINISFQGNYSQICGLFNDFKKLSNQLEFKNLQLHPQNEEIINVTMFVIFYKSDLTGGENL